MFSFSELGLAEPLQQALRAESYSHPTPVQAQAIPAVLEGRDLLGCARTGTGKTAAFALPILQRLSSAPSRAAARRARALVLAPTRELAAQVGESFRTYGRHTSLSVAVVSGGVGQGPQVRALARGVDVLVATPGRLLDLMNQGHAKLDQVEVLVLDEADHMLDLGFIPDVRRILAALPRRRQTLFFSATMPPAITSLAERILSDPVRVFVTPTGSTVEQVEQSVRFVASAEKAELLTHELRHPSVRRALVFTRTKRGADRVARRLAQDGIRAEAIHGNKSQGARERALESFRSGRSPVLVATDLAARGIDVDGITHVFNFDLPNVPETYVHRIGRTARAGESGTAISLCSPEERGSLRDIERVIRRSLPESPSLAGERPRRPARSYAEPVARAPAAHAVSRKPRASRRGRVPYGHHAGSGPAYRGAGRPARAHR
jgi:ATP-dependent RNA helicase RhlE